MTTYRQTTTELALQQAEARYHSLYHKIPAIVHSIDADGRLVSVSDYWLELLGYQREEVIGRPSTDFLTEESSCYAVETALPEFMRTGVCHNVPYRFVKKNGEILDILLSATAERDTCGRIERSYAVLVNVTPQKEAEQRLQDFLATATQWLWEMDAEYRFTFLSEGYSKAGFVPARILGKTRWEMAGVTPDRDDVWHQHLADLEARRPFRDFECSWIGPDGNEHYRSVSGMPIFDAQGVFKGYRGTSRDITERKQATMTIERLALHDTLTGLPNRLYFTRELERACSSAQRSGGKIAVMFLDLDQFKDVNDALGHAVGDRLLAEVAHRLKTCVRKSDLVARLGGDEFAMIVNGRGELGSFCHLAERIIKLIDEPFEIEGISVRTGISIGITLYPDDEGDIERVLANADAALHTAKADGRRTWRIFDHHLQKRIRAQRSLDQELRNAFEHREFELHYQPLIDVNSGEIRSFEALLRWNHAQRGTVLPSSFIAAAERSRLIVPLTEWILHEAIMQWQCWENAAGLSDVKIAINLSPLTLRVEGFVDFIARSLNATGCHPRQLVIEITESSLIDENKAVPALNALRALGVIIAVDDFGTGYSSMSRLKNLPVDLLKIDRAFLTDITHDEGDATIAESLVKVGRSLRMQVVGEGVETVEQLELLARIGCHQIQGFLVAHPMAAAAVPAWIERWRQPHYRDQQLGRTCGAPAAVDKTRPCGRGDWLTVVS